jgi:hypothetical protein
MQLKPRQGMSLSFSSVQLPPLMANKMKTLSQKILQKEGTPKLREREPEIMGIQSQVQKAYEFARAATEKRHLEEHMSPRAGQTHLRMF